MNYYEKYLKYKTKYLKLKQLSHIQLGGNDDIILYNNDFVGLSRKIKDNKKDIFIDIILWILQDSKFNKETTKNTNGFNFKTNSAKLIFNDKLDGFVFVDNVKASKDEIFELTFIIKNIIEIQITENFNVSNFNFDGKKNIYERMNYIKNYFLKSESNLTDLSEPKQKTYYEKPNYETKNQEKTESDFDKSIYDTDTISEFKKPIYDTDNDDTEMKPKYDTEKPKHVEKSRYDTEKPKYDNEKPSYNTETNKMVEDFEPNTFYPSDYIVGTNAPIPYKKEKDEYFDTSSVSDDSSEY